MKGATVDSTAGGGSGSGGSGGGEGGLGGSGGGGKGTELPSQSEVVSQGGAAAQNSVNRQAGATSLAATPLRQTAQASATNHHPGRPFSAASSSRQNPSATGSGESQPEISNAVPIRGMAATNSPGSPVPGPKVDDSMMSPFNRELAEVLRDIIFGSYLLILFLMLLFAGYRIWRWSQSPVRKRRR